MKRLIIGILGVPTYDDEEYKTIAIYDYYNKMAIKKDFILFMIPPLQDVDCYDTKLEDIPPLTEKEKSIYRDIVDMCDGLILPGGYRMFNFHEYVLNYAIEKDIPILGTCLGMQLLAQVDNGLTSIEELEGNDHKKLGEKYVHDIRIVEGTLLSKIVQKDIIKVNSIHKFHVTKVNKLNISAYSDDGLIEAVELPDKKFVLGVQWHPERMLDYDIYANKIIDSFLDACVISKKDDLIDVY